VVIGVAHDAVGTDQPISRSRPPPPRFEPERQLDGEGALPSGLKPTDSRFNGDGPFKNSPWVRPRLPGCLRLNRKDHEPGRHTSGTCRSAFMAFKG
jgi:hypothetical protein